MIFTIGIVFILLAVLVGIIDDRYFFLSARAASTVPLNLFWVGFLMTAASTCIWAWSHMP